MGKSDEAASREMPSETAAIHHGTDHEIWHLAYLVYLLPVWMIYFFDGIDLLNIIGSLDAHSQVCDGKRKNIFPILCDLRTQFENSEIYRQTAIFTIFFIVAHVFRVSFGIYFSSNDRSYIQAKENFYTQTPDKVAFMKSLETLLTFSHVIALGFIAYSVRGNSPIAIPTIMLLQSLLMWFYNWKFREALKNDKDRLSSLMIIIGDFVIFIISIWMIIIVALPGVYKQFYDTLNLISTAPIVLFGAFFLVFLFEFILSYFGSIWRSIAGLCRCVATVFKLEK